MKRGAAKPWRRRFRPNLESTLMTTLWILVSLVLLVWFLGTDVEA